MNFQLIKDKISKKLILKDQQLLKSFKRGKGQYAEKDINILKKFLDKYYHKMPRTTLRYSIEKLTKMNANTI